MRHPNYFNSFELLTSDIAIHLQWPYSCIEQWISCVHASDGMLIKHLIELDVTSELSAGLWSLTTAQGMSNSLFLMLNAKCLILNTAFEFRQNLIWDSVPPS